MKKDKKILFIVAHRQGRSPGQRFRFEQYLDYLVENGFSYEISNFLSERDDNIFYSKGNYLKKLIILLKSILKRLKDVSRANQFDVVFIYRDAIMIGVTWFEYLFSKSRAKVIIDFDDAIWMTDVSQGNAGLGWLKRPSKTSSIIKYSDLVLVGNSYLADYAKQFNHRVEVMPTTLDTLMYKKKEIEKQQDNICIGWTGSSTTLKHLDTAIPVLKRIKEKYKEKVCLKIIADTPYENPELELEQIKWNPNTAVEDLNLFDIGIMPLPDDKWSKGKCGFKALQYMSVEVPAVVSPVGVNVEIVEDGKNGFIASSEDEWFAKLSLLIESEELRGRLGRNGRETVIKRYSFDSQKERYIGLFDDLIKA